MSEDGETTNSNTKDTLKEKFSARIETWRRKIVEAIDTFFPETAASIQRSVDRGRQRLHAQFPEYSYQKEDFDLNVELEHRNGPFIEVAGPTQEGYQLVDVETLPQKLIVSNKDPGVETWDHSVAPSAFVGFEGSVDFQADATRLPLRDSAVGVLFASCLPHESRIGLLFEARRVLEIGGLFVWQGLLDRDIQNAQAVGFEVVKYTKEDIVWDIDAAVNENIQRQLGQHSWNVILQKQSIVKDLFFAE